MSNFMIETTDINNAAERRDIITKYGMLEQAYSEITFCWQETSEKEYPWQQDHLAGEQDLMGGGKAVQIQSEQLPDAGNAVVDRVAVDMQIGRGGLHTGGWL